MMDRLNGMAGGGPQGEKNEDTLDKGRHCPFHIDFACCVLTLHSGIDWVQEHVFKQGPQNNESATEQAKDKFIAQNIRQQYHNATGKEFPVKEKRV